MNSGGLIDLTNRWTVPNFQAAYQAAFDQVNEAGGINGRTIEAVYTPIVPIRALRPAPR
jgi:hypothetical protein